MADFNTLIADIEAAIYENTEQAITGDALQDILLEMVDAMNTAKQDALTLTLPLAYDGDGALTLKYDDFQFDLGGGDDALTLRLTFGLVSNSSGVQVYAGDGLTFGDEGQLLVNIGEGLEFYDGEIVPDYQFVQPLIGDLADIRYNAAHPIHWLGASPVTASEDFIYTGDGMIYPPSEYDEVHFWLVNYTDRVQSIDLLKWYGDGADPTSVTLQPWQVAYVTGVYDDNLGAQWSVEGSGWYEKPAAGIPATDLASAVQTSLGKADTAVQSATISTIVSLSQQDYDDLVDKDAATLYVIV